ncbi:MAG: phosphate ABC transporter substrate-binding protein [Lachnospiraceae bacterium]|nr:phosphate ABC transporter substrate-binding protein [Lachnospiraceae bacterium]
MKKNSCKLIALIGACVLLTGALTGCGNSDSSAFQGVSASQESTQSTQAASSQESSQAAQDAGTQTSALSGTITMSGSTSMEKLATALCEAFMEKYPDVTATAEFTGSGAGIEAVSAGTVDIGNSSRNLKDEEKEAGVAENIVAIDGIAVCVTPDSSVTNLTKDELISIYTGEIANWKDLGGDDEPIVVVGREAGSGTRGAFEELLGIEDACNYANELDSTGAVIAKVASTPGAIGYASLDAIDDTVKAVSLEGVEATAENIKAGSYFLCRPFVMATKGEISEQSELVQAWFEFVLGDEGQAIAENIGLITVQ